MIPLDSIIEDLQGELGSETQHDYAHLLRFAVRAVEDLHYDVSGYVKRAELEPDSTGMVQLPEDFVKEARVAIIGSSGQLMFLGRNENIFKPLNNCGIPTQPQGGANSNLVGTMDTSGSQHVKNGEIIGAYYGVGGRQTAGEFRMNREANRIELSSNLSSSVVVLDYLARPSQINGKFMVHEFLQDAVMLYCMWKSKRWFVGTGEARNMQRAYTAAKNFSKVRFGGMGEEEMLEISRRNFSPAPKY